jgi:uncharacterized membrane-anchored protein
MPDKSMRAKRFARVWRSALFIGMALLVQIAILGGLTATRWSTPSSSKTIYLTVGPVDPTDLLRGDYVTLSYPAIRSLPAEDFAKKPKKGQDVWVEVSRSGAAWDYRAAYTSQPTKNDLTDPGNVAIRGRVSSVSGSKVAVVYGIEEYWVPKGKGNLPPGKNVLARVLVGTNGTAKLDALVIDGRIWP